MNTLEESIAQHPFWKGLPSQYVALLKQCATFKHFEAQQQIFASGSQADCFYLIRHGHVAIETPFIPGRGIVIIQTVGDGEALGWSWFFPPYEWHYSARAIEPTEMIAFQASTLRENAAAHCGFGYDLAMRIGQIMLQRLQATRLQLLDVYGH